MRLGYTTSFKLQVIQYAEDLQVVNLMWTNSALGYGVNKTKKRLENAPKSKQAFRGKQSAFPQLVFYHTICFVHIFGHFLFRLSK
jgi:hypothetical protein